MSRQDLYQQYQASEVALITDLRSGQPEAVEFWFKQYHDRLLAIVQLKISNPHDAEELVQETFVNALKQLPLFRGDAQLMTWMFAIARHEIADYFRKKYAKKAIQALPLSDELLQALMPQRLNDSHEISEKVKVAVQSLTSNHRELLLAKYLDGKKVEELARELGRSVKAIESELFRAREAFKSIYITLPD